MCVLYIYMYNISIHIYIYNINNISRQPPMFVNRSWLVASKIPSLPRTYLPLKKILVHHVTWRSVFCLQWFKVRHADTASSAERSTASYSQTPLENQEVMQALTSTLSDPTGALTVKVKRFTISRDRDEPSTSPPSSATSEIIYHMFFGTNMDPFFSEAENLRFTYVFTEIAGIEPKTHGSSLPVRWATLSCPNNPSHFGTAPKGRHGPPQRAVSGWWLNQPIWKICSSKWVHLPQIGMENIVFENHHLGFCCFSCVCVCVSLSLSICEGNLKIDQVLLLEWPASPLSSKCSSMWHLNSFTTLLHQGDFLCQAAWEQKIIVNPYVYMYIIRTYIYICIIIYIYIIYIYVYISIWEEG